MDSGQLTVDSGQVKTGYKQTEVGVIPEDWDVREIGSFSNAVRGGSPRPAGHPKFFGGNYIPWLTVAALTNIPDSSLYVSQTVGFLTEEGAKQSRTLETGTLIVANSGATLGVAKILAVRCCANDGIAALLDIDESVDTLFLCYTLNSKTKEFREVIATGNGQPNLNTTLISHTKIPLPPPAEQRAIAEALSDVDALIAGLERLIAKKRAIKQGAMQQLLTGQTRLPGFGDGQGYKQSEVGIIPEDWEAKLFGELVSVRKQKFDPRRTESRPFCVELEQIGQGTGHLFGDAELSENSSIKVVFRKNDVLFGKLRAYLRKYWFADRDGVATTEIWPFVANPAFTLPKYVYQIVQTDNFIQAASTTYGTHMPRTDWDVVKNYTIALPPTIEEQRTIAQILSDMDAEIEALERRRDKTRAIKQGMMQELLTGRVRLVDS